MSKTLNTQIIHKHATQAEWDASNYTPLKAELIVYDTDTNVTFPRIKIGDGRLTVSALPFLNQIVSEALITLIGDDANKNVRTIATEVVTDPTIELITLNDIDTICGTIIEVATLEEVTF